MNIVFWFIILLVAVALWFVLDIFFIPLGKFILKKINKTLNILKEETEKEEVMEEKING